MKKLLYLSTLAILAQSCIPDYLVVKRQDPFTGAISRMTTDYNTRDDNYEMVLAAMQSRSARRTIPADLVRVSQVENEPFILNVQRTYREKYQMPDSAKILVKFSGGKIVTLPVQKKWYTINGPLVAKAEMPVDVVTLFTTRQVTNIRIEPVSENEEDPSYYDVLVWKERGVRLQSAVRELYYLATGEEPWRKQREQVRETPKKTSSKKKK